MYEKFNFSFNFIVGVSMTGCAGVEKNISADDCGCPENDRKTKLSKDKNPNMTAD